MPKLLRDPGRFSPPFTRSPCRPLAGSSIHFFRIPGLHSVSSGLPRFFPRCFYTPIHVNVVYSVFEEVPMQRTNVVLDEKLVQEGLKLFKKKTKRELIDFALREVIRREKARGILALEGKVKWEGDLQEMRKGRFADLG